MKKQIISLTASIIIVLAGYSQTKPAKTDTSKKTHDTLRVVIVDQEFINALNQIVNKTEAPYVLVQQFWDLFTPQKKFRIIVDGKLQ